MYRIRWRFYILCFTPFAENVFSSVSFHTYKLRHRIGFTYCKLRNLTRFIMNDILVAGFTSYTTHMH